MSLGDLVIIIVVLILAVHGYRRGFVREAIEAVGALVAAFATYRFHAAVAAILGVESGSCWVSKIALCVVMFLVVMILVTLIGKMFTRFLESINLGAYNKLVGLLLGVTKAAMIAGVVTLAAIWAGPDGEKIVAESKLAKANLVMLQFLSRGLPDDLKQKFDTLSAGTDSSRSDAIITPACLDRADRQRT